MRSIIYTSFLLLTLFLFGCTSGKEPDDVAEKFLKAVANQRYERAKKFSTARTASMLDVVKSLSTIAPKEKRQKDYEVLDYEINGNFATVKYKVKGSDVIDQLRLVKEGEEWRVGSMPDVSQETNVSSI